MKASGIYQIKNIINNKVYIGDTVKTWRGLEMYRLKDRFLV